MSLKTIQVCLTTLEHAEALVKFALPLARKYNAHLVGVHAVESLMVYPGMAMHVPETAFVMFNEGQDEQSDAIKAVFEKHTEKEAFPSEFRLVSAGVVSASERMVESARTADLVIMAQADHATDRYDQRYIQVDVIRNSGRPVLVVPTGYSGPEIGKTIVLGWSDTREAARAAHDMLNIAEPGAEITILRVRKSTKDELEDSIGISLAEMLARHDFKPTLAHRSPSDSNIAGVLNQVAFEQGADLIVTGALGHSKAYDFVIGATTHALLRDSKYPVLFSK